MMTIGIPTITPAPAPKPTEFYVPNTELTRQRLLKFGIPEAEVERALGGTWPIGRHVHLAPIEAVTADGPMGGWYFPVDAIQLL